MYPKLPKEFRIYSQAFLAGETRAAFGSVCRIRRRVPHSAARAAFGGACRVRWRVPRSAARAASGGACRVWRRMSCSVSRAAFGGTRGFQLACELEHC
jgi:hypothetical protein